MRRFKCLPCIGHEHGHQCTAGPCSCLCRRGLGLDGPFEHDDPTATGLHDVPDPDEDWVA